MNTNILHITLNDLFFAGIISVGLTFAVSLAFAKNGNRTGNRLLAAALLLAILEIAHLLIADIEPGTRLLSCSMAIGPLIYLYVLKYSRPSFKLSRKHLLHFIPVLIQLFFQRLEIIAPLSIVLYTYRSQQLISDFYRQLEPVLMDRPLAKMRWLRRLLKALLYVSVLWQVGSLIIPTSDAVFSMVFVIIMIRLAALAFLAPLTEIPAQIPAAAKPMADAELKQKGSWLKKAMEAGHFYRDPELTLGSLSEQLGVHTHELSRVINIALKKNFYDFINEYRVMDVARKMHDPAYNHITLLGIAFEAGFNSKSTFNRIFRQVTGKSPAEFKKESPTYKLRRSAHFQPVTLHREIHENLNRSIMFRNYLKIAFRNLLAKKAFSFINITGLAVGMAGAILIGLWVQNEYSFDMFHTNNQTLYKVWYRFPTKDYVGTLDITAGPLAGALKQEFPEVKSASRIYWSENRLFNYKDISLKATGNEVDKDFLTMFTFPLIKGSKQHAFDDVNSIVLTQHLADKIFGTVDPLNQLVKLDNKQPYKVTGVMQDLPNNTQFDFEYLVPLPADGAFHDNRWNTNSYYAYVQLQPDADVNQLNKKIRLIVQNHVNDKNNNTEVFLYPFSKMHLYSRFDNGKVVGGKIEVIRLLLIIAGIILLTACINFMNLSTAQSQKRAMEVGVRKVMGAARINLVGQFLAESLAITVIAGLAALIIAQLCLPAFNGLTAKHLFIPYLQPVFWLVLFLLIVLTGILAGSYPAFFLSAFKPVRVLKGRFSAVNRLVNPRKVLVVVQFAVAVVLIVSTIVVYRQINYAQSRDTGYKIDHLVEVPIEGDIRKNFPLIKNELVSSGAAVSACETSIDVTIDGAHDGGFSTDGTNRSQQNLDFSKFGTSGDFIKTMGLTLLGGRDIDFNEYPSDSTSCLLNETAVKQLNIKNPVGSTIYQGSQPVRVVGVIKDFIINSPYVNTGPMIVISSKTWAFNSVIRLNSNKSTAKNLETATKIFKKYNPAYPFNYQFVDTAYQQKFNDQQQTGKLAALFACLTVFISCLGLFGLASYMAENRSKEIGIRKVLGASVARITTMLTREFVALVLIAIVIAVPLAFWATYKWLQDFPYRISVGWLTFVLAGLLTIIIAVLTVGAQSVRAAMSNPTRSIRSE